MANCNNRFDMTINNTKIFPPVVPCLDQKPLEFKRYREDGSDWDAADAADLAAGGDGNTPWGPNSLTEPLEKEGY